MDRIYRLSSHGGLKTDNKYFVAYTKMPKAKVEEKEMPVEEVEPEAPEANEEVPETPQPEVVAKPKQKASAKPKAEPKAKGLDLKQKHTCGQCGKTMSLHTALYSHKCPSDVSIPQPPALVRQTAVEPIPEPVPQYSHAQLPRMQLAQAAQERRAQAQLRMTAPIRQFYGLQ